MAIAIAIADQINCVTEGGDTTVTNSADGTLASEVRYTAFGEIREGNNGVTVTDNKYTGQREEVEIGLDYYVARWYDPVLAHFIQADTIVPKLGDISSFDRYNYTNYSPCGNSDPSGHCSFSTSIALNPMGFYASCYQDVIDAYDSYKNGNENVGILYLEATGIKDAIVETAEKVNQLNSDVATVFSNAPLKERILPSIRLGTFSVSTAATLVGIGQAAGEGGKALFTNKGINYNEYGPASSYANKLRLDRQLASEQQMGEVGRRLAGNGTQRGLRVEQQLIKNYGGNKGEWAKMGSNSYQGWDGIRFETHWYENLVTGFRAQYKTKIIGRFTRILGNSIFGFK